MDITRLLVGTSLISCIAVAGSASAQCGEMSESECRSKPDSAVATVSYDRPRTTGQRESAAKGENIVQVAIDAGGFQTLVAAVKAAGLVDALSGPGPFTVFAPTDEAFAKLPKGTVEELLKPENKATLTAILTYHVVPGRVTANEVTRLTFARTLQGQRIDIATRDGKVRVDNANVTQTDIKASNGVIHVIDTVIMPAMDDIPTTASKAGSFNTLLAAATAAGLVDALKGPGPLTVFAPTDEAFQKLGNSTIQDLLKPENKDRLVQILTYHVVQGAVYSDQISKMRSASTLSSKDVQVRISEGRVMLNRATVVTADIEASNGVIHVIDTVLIPE